MKLARAMVLGLGILSVTSAQGAGPVVIGPVRASVFNAQSCGPVSPNSR